MIDAYIVTAAQAFLGTFLSVIVMALCAYSLSRRNYLFRKHVTYYIFFTMLFGGGLIPSYIINTQYLKMGNTFWIYIFPGLASAFTIIIFRTFFQGLPESLVESAKLDGASELLIFYKIMLPLSKPVLATFALFGVLDRWNNWATSLIYIREQHLYTLQFLLQRILMELEFIKALAEINPTMADASATTAPTESMKFAMVVVAAGPALVVFPFFQKYFTKGLTIGAVKG
jgi:putative aldouronate transport system permease protein